MATKIDLNNYGIYEKRMVGHKAVEVFMCIEAPSEKQAVKVYRNMIRGDIGKDFKIVGEEGTFRERRMFAYIAKRAKGNKLQWDDVSSMASDNRQFNIENKVETEEHAGD